MDFHSYRELYNTCHIHTFIHWRLRLPCKLPTRSSGAFRGSESCSKMLSTCSRGGARDSNEQPSDYWPIRSELQPPAELHRLHPACCAALMLATSASFSNVRWCNNMATARGGRWLNVIDVNVLIFHDDDTVTISISKYWVTKRR